MAASGTSSTETVGRSTVRPKISGDASPMSASTALMTGITLRTTLPSSMVTFSGVSPSRIWTMRRWARSLICTHRFWNVSEARNPSTRSRTKPSRALVSGTARIWPRSGRASSNSDSGSINVISSSVTHRPSAACTSGASAIGPTVATQRSVLRALRRAHTPPTVTVATTTVTNTSTAARTLRSRPPLRALPSSSLVRSSPTSASSRACSSRRRSISASSTCGDSSMGATVRPVHRRGIARCG